MLNLRLPFVPWTTLTGHNKPKITATGESFTFFLFFYGLICIFTSFLGKGIGAGLIISGSVEEISSMFETNL